MKYDTIQYNTIQYNTIQYNTIQYNFRDTMGELSPVLAHNLAPPREGEISPSGHVEVIKATNLFVVRDKEIIRCQVSI